MYKYIDIDNTNFKKTSESNNKIKVSTDFIKWKGLVVYFQEWNFKQEGVFNSFSFDMFGSKSYRLILESMTRKNQKKIDEVTKNFFEKHTNQDLINILIDN